MNDRAIYKRPQSVMQKGAVVVWTGKLNYFERSRDNFGRDDLIMDELQRLVIDREIFDLEL
jgi:hypothetical protein